MDKKYSFSLGADNFRELVSSDELNVDPNKLFVDKSLFIKDFIDNNSKVLLITRPRRWGKSLILSMLQHFFSNEVNGMPTENLFKSLKISEYITDNSKYKDYKGQYPVILVSFKDLQGLDYPTTEERVKEIIAELYRQHLYLLKSTVLEQTYKSQFERIVNKQAVYGEFVSSLKFLSELLYKHYGKKVYVFIDEYDSMLNNSYNNPELLEKITIFFNTLFGSCLKSNFYLEKGFITGVLRVVSGNIFYGLNNLSEYTVLDNNFSEYYGFTRSEVNELFSKINFHKDEEIKNWYNGYLIGNNAIYNPWSIMQCLSNNGQLTPYWIKSSNPSILKDLLMNKSSIEHKLTLLELIKTGTANLKLSLKSQISLEQMNTDLEYLWSVLVHAGYLTIVSPTQPKQIKLPNTEIAELIKEYIHEWFVSNPLLTITTNSLLAGDLVCFKNTLKEVLVYDEALSYLLNTATYNTFNSTQLMNNKHLNFKEFLYQFLIMVELKSIVDKETAIYAIILESHDNNIYKKELNFTTINHEKKLYMVGNVKENKDKNIDLTLFAKERCLKQIDINNLEVKVQTYKLIRIGIAFCDNEFEIIYI
jgi:hypothetical protein